MVLCKGLGVMCILIRALEQKSWSLPSPAPPHAHPWLGIGVFKRVRLGQGRGVCWPKLARADTGLYVSPNSGVQA